MLFDLGQWIGQQHRVREDRLLFKDGDSYTKRIVTLVLRVWNKKENKRRLHKLLTTCISQFDLYPQHVNCLSFLQVVRWNRTCASLRYGLMFHDSTLFSGQNFTAEKICFDICIYNITQYAYKAFSDVFPLHTRLSLMSSHIAMAPNRSNAVLTSSQSSS